LTQTTVDTGSQPEIASQAAQAVGHRHSTEQRVKVGVTGVPALFYSHFKLKNLFYRVLKMAAFMEVLACPVCLVLPRYVNVCKLIFKYLCKILTTYIATYKIVFQILGRFINGINGLLDWVV
jgi:hypothetical protein